jgi:two-component system OmpR family sensor kinase
MAGPPEQGARSLRTHFDLIPLDQARNALPGRLPRRSNAATLVLDPAHKAFYRRVDLSGERYIGSEAEVIRADHLPIDLGQALLMEVVRYVVVALALLVPIALWSRTHWQGLQTLSRVADEFGAGKLSARARMKPSEAVYPLAERINAMAGRIQGLLESQKNLLHSVSHELRTPIARLEFALELLGRGASDDPALRNASRRWKATWPNSNELVNELLSMSKLDNAHRNRSASCSNSNRCCANAPTACIRGRQRCASSWAPALGSIDGDRRLLARGRQPAAQCPEIRGAYGGAAARAATAGRVEIASRTTVPAFRTEERERIFEPFYRLDRSRDRATGGFGLGLSIARKAVALHGGDAAWWSARRWVGPGS